MQLKILFTYVKIEKNEINKEVKSEPPKLELNKIELDKNIDMLAPSTPKKI